jgi:4-amino-4-deoxy-L-arabinose transferase-like glycosyltransferase
VPVAGPEQSTYTTTGRRAALTVFLVGLGLRVLWAALVPQVIESEGSNYARVGENLALGRGYLGLREAGLQLLYPPLYPCLIAGGTWLGLAPEVAGRTASLLFGSVLPLLVLALGRRLHGERAGVAGAWLAALHPLLIALSGAVLTESTYLTLILGSVLCATRAMDPDGRPRDALAAGVLGTLAYYTRPEGLLLSAVCAGLIALSRRPAPRPALTRGVLLGLTTALLGLAYAVPLSLHVGAVRFEAKTPAGTGFARRAAAGESDQQIYSSIDSRLRDTGLSNISNLELLHLPPPSPFERIEIAVGSARRNLPKSLLYLVARPLLGNPLLFLLSVLGLASVRWTRDQAWRSAPLLVLAALNLVTVTAWPHFHEHFVFPLLVPGVVWAGAGLAALPGFTERGWRGLRLSGGLAGRTPVLATALLVVAALWGLRRADEVSEAWDGRRIGQRILGTELRKELPWRARLADVDPTVSYYAGAVLQPLPWTTDPVAARYLDLRAPDVVVLDRQSMKAFPYGPGWFRSGVPLPGWHRLGHVALGPDEAWVDAPPLGPLTRAGGELFPLRVDRSGRYLLDAQGRPFRITGDAGWDLPVQLAPADVERYLERRARQGFNTVLLLLLEHKRWVASSHAPLTWDGLSPLQRPGDFSAPNDAYFQRLAWVIDRARAHGLLVLGTPMYLGLNGGDEGWWQELNLPGNTREVCHQYGVYLARGNGGAFTGLRDRPNLIWVEGGDFLPPFGSEGEARAHAVMEGLRDGGALQLQTAHWSEEHLASDEPEFAPDLQLQAVYTYGLHHDGQVLVQARRGYATLAGPGGEARPAFLIETEYETSAGLPRTGPLRWTKLAWRRIAAALGRKVPATMTAREVRRRTYQAQLSLIGGVVFGNQEVWTFGPEWVEALESDGARDMRHLTKLLDSVPWWELVPSGLGALRGTEAIAGPDDAAAGGDVAAAASPDRRWLIAYVPGRGTGPRRLQVRGPDAAHAGSLRIRWFDPTAGISSLATVTTSPGDLLEVVTPGPNADGDGDWVLVVEPDRATAPAGRPEGP